MFSKKLILCGLIGLTSATLVLSDSLAQTTYYVANTGSDTNNGCSASSSFQTISRVNKLILQAGDSVLFRRGDTFQGGLLLRQSGSAGKPIFIGAYGSGPKPILTGSATITNWTRLSGNRWQAPCPACGSRVTGLYRTGVALPLGRYPNADAGSGGYLTIQSHTGNTQLTSQQPLTTNWVGAEAVVRPTYWIIDRAIIAKQNGNTLTLTNASTYILTDGWGYFIQNHPATLDQNGEWYYNPATQVLQLYNDQGSPADQHIMATVIDQVITITNASFITIRDLHITQAKSENLYAENGSNLVLINNDFTNSGEDGVTLQGTGNQILLEDNTITNSNNNGLYIGRYQDVSIHRNTVRRAGLLAGRGKNGDGQFTGLLSFATQNTVIENNVIDSIGYNGMTIWNNTLVRQNLISNFCMTKSDGGGIYLWNGLQATMQGINIRSNIIQKGIGTVGGTADTTRSGAHGIFLDDCVEAVTLADNTIFDCHGLGIYLHAINNVQLLRNTCFNNSVAQVILYKNNEACETRNNTLTGNILVSKEPANLVAGYFSNANDLTNFGSMEANYYVRPFNDSFTIGAVYNQTIGDNLSLSQWQTRYKQDLTSSTSPVTYKDYRLKSLSNNSRIYSDFNLTSDGWDTWSPYANSQASYSADEQRDGGSLQIRFANSSGKADSYALVYKGLQSVVKAKSYLLRFDVAAESDKKLVVYIRQRQAPYHDLTSRYEILIGKASKHYELAFTALADDADALLTYQLQETNESVWLDNVDLREAVISTIKPGDFIHLLYNPTLRDSVVRLEYSGWDVKKQFYTRQLTLKPFTSVVFLRNPADTTITIVTETEVDNLPVKRNAVYPNPTVDEFTFVAEDNITTLRVMDMIGQQHIQTGGLRRGQIIRFGHDLPSAIYVLSIEYKTGEQRTVKLIKLSK